MIEGLRLRWPGSGYSASTVNPLLSDYPVDLDRRLLPHSAVEWSPAANLTADTALSNSAWWRAIRLTAGIVSRTPFEIKNVEKSKQGIKKTSATDHPGYYATSHQANSEETASDCFFRVTASSVMFGAGYAAIRRDLPDGYRLYPFESQGTRKMRIEGKLWYFFDLNPGSVEDYVTSERFRKFPAEDVIEVSGLKKRGLLAYSTWWYAKNVLAEGASAAAMRGARATNGGKPSIILSTEQTVNEQTSKRIIDDFARVHSSFEGVGRPALLDRGLTASTLPYAPDFQAEETLVKIPQREIANFTGIPSVFLGDPDGISYESLEKMIELLYIGGIEDYWHAWEDQIRAKLLTDDERRSGNVTAEFDRASMVYMDGKTQALLIRAWGGGVPIGTANNIRGKLGWEPLDDPEADKLQIPKNIGQDGSNNTPADGQANDPGRPKTQVDGQPLVRSMANAWDDTTRRILKAAERVASNDKAFMAFCDSLDADAEIRGVAWERSRAAGSVYNLLIDEDAATAGLRSCKESLLDVAGSATKGQLHAAFHEKYGSLMVTLPERAAKAVLEASCSKTY